MQLVKPWFVGQEKKCIVEGQQYRTEMDTDFVGMGIKISKVKRQQRSRFMKRNMDGTGTWNTETHSLSVVSGSWWLN